MNQQPPRPDEGLLAGLLTENGSTLSANDVADVIRGVLAAPRDIDPQSWMALIAPQPDNELRRQLAALFDDMDAESPDTETTTAQRLQRLRRELDDRGLDGIIIPRSDEHLGEYVSRRAERLAWATGFTGSAGMAIVLSDTAAVFVDSRYTLQAAHEVDSALFETHDLIAGKAGWPVGSWLTTNAKGRIGYDAWLHTPAQAARLRAAVEQSGAEWVACDDNPIDAVWADQPPPPISLVHVHDAAFSGRSSSAKRAEIGDSLKAAGQNATVLSAPDSIAWLLNIRGGDVPFSPLTLAFAICHEDATVDLFIDARKLGEATRKHLGDDVRIHTPDAFGPELDRLGKTASPTATTVGVDRGGAPEWIFNRLSDAGAVVENTPDPCVAPKACKNDIELSGMRAAHHRDGVALCKFLAWIKREGPGGGVSEISASDKVDALRAEGDHFRGLSFPTISGAGPNGAIVHYRVTPETDRQLETGTLYLVDSGAQYLDGTTDVTRTVAIGQPSAEMRDRFTRVLKGHIGISSAVFPEGTSGWQLDPLARIALWEAGIDYGHGTGHGVGCYLGVHEGPQRISKQPGSPPLEPGMVISNEPGYYREGAYGIRCENLLIVTALDGDDDAGETGAEGAGEGADGANEFQRLGFEVLTLAPFDRTLIDLTLLTRAEIDWINTYHDRVRNTLSADLDRETADWLADATRPLQTSGTP